MSDKLRLIVLTDRGVEAALGKSLDLECAEVSGAFIETDMTRRYSLRDKVKRSIRYDGFAVTLSMPARKLHGRDGIYDDDIKRISRSRGRLQGEAALGPGFNGPGAGPFKTRRMDAEANFTRFIQITGGFDQVKNGFRRALATQA
jgi:hypothetical protein